MRFHFILLILKGGVNSKKKYGLFKHTRKRVAFVLIDWLGDVSIPRFGYKTPIEAANVPNLDAISSAGFNGLLDPVEVRLGCGSDTAHLSILGYDPHVYCQGRGVAEVMGAGLAMAPGDIAFKKLNRKLLHITFGLGFMLCWPLFSSGMQGAALASLVPGVNILKVLLIGLGIVKDEATVNSMSRSGDYRELIKGPMYYAITITL